MNIIVVMVYLNWISLIFAAALTLVWALGIRDQTKKGMLVTEQAVNTVFLWMLSIALVLGFRVSALHLLWLFPVWFFVGAYTLNFPLSIVSIPGSVLYKILTVGLDTSFKNTLAYQRTLNEIAESVLALHFKGPEKLKPNGVLENEILESIHSIVTAKFPHLSDEEMSFMVPEIYETRIRYIVFAYSLYEPEN